MKFRHSPALPPRFAAVLLAFAVSFVAASAADAPRPWADAGFAPLTAERIAALPEAERGAWEVYLKESAARQRAHEAVTTKTKPPVAPGAAPKSTGATKSKGLRPRAAAEWYASAEAHQIADGVIAWQSSTGGWTKGNNYTQPAPPAPRLRETWSGGTFDNESTIPELRFLATVLTAAPAGTPGERKAAWRAAFDRGLDYVFAAQYPNGGFPQVYPLVGGYHDAVTFNDNAMGHVLGLLRDLAAGKPEFAFVPEAVRREAGERFQRGIACILAAQIREADGRRTVWCQQHDPLTLAPCAARNFEPVAACTGESTALVDLLLPLRDGRPEVDAALRGAFAWFERVALRDVVWDHGSTTKPLVASPGASPLWARMYELGTDKPIFGERDRTIHYDLAEISPERQHGYAWFGDWPTSRLVKWQKLAAKETAAAAKQAAADAKQEKAKAKAKP